MELGLGNGRSEDIREVRDSKVTLELNEWDTAGGLRHHSNWGPGEGHKL